MVGELTPFNTIAAGVRGAIFHEHSINKLTNLKLAKSAIKILVKNIHRNVIKCLTYLILNKRKPENKQDMSMYFNYSIHSLREPLPSVLFNPPDW
jgi:hypothetical protein